VLSFTQAALVVKVSSCFTRASGGFTWESGGFAWVAYPLYPAVAWAPAGFGGR